MKKILALLLCVGVIMSSLTVCFAASVKEINTVGNMYTESAKSVNADGSDNKNLSNPDKLTDGERTTSSENGKADNGADNFTRGDYCIDKDAGQYIKITLGLDKVVDFSGIRIYSRKTDAGNHYVKANNAEKITLEFTDGSGNTVKTAELVGTPAEQLSDDSWDVPYVDFTVASGKETYLVSGAKKIVINILSTFNEQKHFGAEEILLTSGASTTKKTVAELKALGFKAPTESASTSTTKKEDTTTSTSTSTSASTSASFSTAGEINTFGNMYVESAKSVNADGSDNKELSNRDKLTDGELTSASESGKADNGMDNFTRGDYCINTETGQYIKITLGLDKAVDFSGIRIYSRKKDENSSYVKINNAEKITLEFTDGSGNTVKTAELVGTPAKALSGEEGKSWDVPYVDFTVSSGNKNYTVSGAKKIVVNIMATFGNQQHFGSEEIKLTNNAANAEKKTVAELKKLGFTAPSASAGTEEKKEETVTETNSNYLPKTDWTIKHDRESSAAPELAIDGKDTTYWHSKYYVVDGAIASKEDPPFDLDITLPGKTLISGVSLLPRQDSNSSGIPSMVQYFGLIDGEYKDLGTFNYPSGKSRKTEAFKSNIEISGLRVRVLAGVAGYGTVAEIDLLKPNDGYKTLAYDEFVQNEAEQALYSIDKSNATAEFVGGGHWGNNVIGNIVDGNESSFFQDGATPRANYTAVINVDLGAAYDVVALGYYPRQGDKDGYWFNYKVYASEDGQSFTEIADVQNDEVDQSVNTVTLDKKTKARFFRYEISKAYGNLFSCSELYFYEDYESHSTRAEAEKQEFKLVIGKNEIVANGEAVALDVAPYIENGTTFIPLRGLLELMGAEIEWKDENQSITVKKDLTTIFLQIRNFNVDVTEPKNGTVRYSLLAAPRITDSRTFVPIRFISEHLGYNVGWDGETQTVTITN